MRSRQCLWGFAQSAYRALVASECQKSALLAEQPPNRLQIQRLRDLWLFEQPASPLENTEQRRTKNFNSFPQNVKGRDAF